MKLVRQKIHRPLHHHDLLICRRGRLVTRSPDGKRQYLFRNTIHSPRPCALVPHQSDLRAVALARRENVLLAAVFAELPYERGVIHCQLAGVVTGKLDFIAIRAEVLQPE